MPDRIATFALALPLYRLFEYRVPDDDPLLVGTRYRLPFGSGVKTGILVAAAGSGTVEADKIKPVQERLDEAPVIDPHLFELMQWLAEYYRQPLGELLFQSLPAKLRGQRPYTPVRLKRWRLLPRADDAAIDALAKRSPRQYELCRALRDNPPGLTASALRAVHENWRATMRSLERKALVEWVYSEADTPVPPRDELPRLSDEQSTVLTQITGRLDRFAVHLLDGITGSGKTEIYLRLIQQRLDAGQQIIYLVPEIGLTGQLIERVQRRFGDCFVLSHSALTQAQRFDAWDRFRRGERRIMLGTRSSLFSQCEGLGLIIVDEEHDPSYRQEDGIRYHARDVAIKRAQMLDIPILLGSATPSLETLHNCRRDTWFRYRLDQRPTRFPPPPIQLVDVRNSQLQQGLSIPVLERIERHLAHAGQVLVYLNRRGFAPVVMCHECNWQAQCEHCDARLTLHQSVHALVCHHCGFTRRVPEQCPECDHDEIKHYGMGTEQLEQALTQRFPEVPVLRIDRDVIASREALQARLEQLHSGDPCLLIGTQMIAKGHDYPAITLSVVLDADQALFSAAYRASERLAQTLFQVAGRSGRGDRQGEALVQTRFIEHPLMVSLARQDYRSIAVGLLSEREALAFPPFARVVMFRADGVELKAALQMLEDIKVCLAATPEYGRVTCVGPIPALMTRRIGRYRAQLCLIATDHARLRSVLRDGMPAIEALPSSNRVNWSIDVDALDL